MNLKLLNRIKRKIAAEPRQFIMTAWYYRHEDIPNCGTAACIGGWAAAIASKLKPDQACDKYGDWVFDEGMKALDIDHTQATRLFVIDQWPEKYLESFKAETFRNAKHNAKVAIARINHFIKTKGRE